VPARRRALMLTTLVRTLSPAQGALAGAFPYSLGGEVDKRGHTLIRGGPRVARVPQSAGLRAPVASAAPGGITQVSTEPGQVHAKSDSLSEVYDGNMTAAIERIQCGYRSIFTPATRRERAANFEAYLAYSVEHDGEILEDQKGLRKKQQILTRFQSNPVRSGKPLPDPEGFYRNYVKMEDDPRTLDRMTLLLTFLYKFARHEFVGISAAWDASSRIAESTSMIAKIGRYHLCEEFSHVRLFHEMFRTFHLDKVEWVPPGKWMGRMYRLFPRFPEAFMAPPAFVTELMGLTVYQHIDGVLDKILADEPEARERVRALLREITTDELAHVGQRRNFMGPVGLGAARLLVEPMYRAFFRNIPETRLLFDLDRMIRDGKTFDYGSIAPEIVEKSWVPSYCKRFVAARGTRAAP